MFVSVFGSFLHGLGCLGCSGTYQGTGSSRYRWLEAPLHLMEARSSWLFFRARFSRGFRDAFTRFPPGFRQVFARFSQGFRKVFARLSPQKYFRERLGRAEKSLINFCVPRGPPPHRAAEPGPPRHAKIGKNHRNQRSTAKK